MASSKTLHTHTSQMIVIFYFISSLSIGKPGLKQKDLPLYKGRVCMFQLRDLQHDNLVRFQGICLESKDPYILTEYCAKGSLQVSLQTHTQHHTHTYIHLHTYLLT